MELWQQKNYTDSQIDMNEKCFFLLFFFLKKTLIAVGYETSSMQALAGWLVGLVSMQSPQWKLKGNENNERKKKRIGK